MKQSLTFLFGLLVMLNCKPVEAQSESPLTNLSLMIGNTYFSVPSHGDGSYRWAEARILFGGRNEYNPTAFGVFVNYVDVASTMDGLLYFDQEWSAGFAMNFGSQYWLPMNEVWGWANLGLKQAKDHGQMNYTDGHQYDGQQKNKNMLYANLGIVLKNGELRGPLFIQKLMVTVQSGKKGQVTAYWDGEPIPDSELTISDKGYVRAVFENTLATVALNTTETIRFEPKIMFGIVNQFADRRTLFSAGLGITLARTYSEELLVIEGSIKFDPQYGNYYYVGANLNVIELGKALFSKN